MFLVVQLLAGRGAFTRGTVFRAHMSLKAVVEQRLKRGQREARSCCWNGPLTPLCAWLSRSKRLNASARANVLQKVTVYPRAASVGLGSTDGLRFVGPLETAHGLIL
jgi:hypothetical protein